MISKTTLSEVQYLSIPFDPHLFVDREEEKELFFENIRATRQQKYLEFTGIAGQGKSEFLKWISYKAKEEGYVVAYIDFEASTYQRPEIYPILETISNHFTEQGYLKEFGDFNKQLSRYIENLREFYLASWSNLQMADSKSVRKLEETVISSFNKALQSILSSHKVVLCLDSTEKAYFAAINSLEEHILKYYTGHLNFMLVTAGQKKMTWKSKEIAARIKQHELSRLNSTGISQQIETLAGRMGVGIKDTEVISDKMLQLTLGHPFSNYKLIDFWTNNFKSGLNRTSVDEQFGQGIRELVEQFIEIRVLKKLQLGSEYPPVGELLWHIAPLRHIDLGTLWFILPIFFKNFTDKDFRFFEALIDKFKHTYIFIPWQGMGFDLDPVIRNIFLWDLHVNFPQKCIELEEKLAEQYDHMVTSPHDKTKVKNIVEHLYHLTRYLKEIQVNDIAEQIQQKLVNYLVNYFSIKATEDKITVPIQLNYLYNALEQDKELASLINVSSLLDIIETFKSSI